MCKYKFLQNPTMIKIFICYSVFWAVLPAFVISLTLNDAFMLTVSSIVIGLFLLLGIFGFFISYNRVYVYEDKIVVKGVFGVLTECRFDGIVKVYQKKFYREGEFIVLRDNREVKRPNSFLRKNCYVRFECTEKSLGILDEFWEGPVEYLDYSESLS